MPSLTIDKHIRFVVDAPVVKNRLVLFNVYNDVNINKNIIFDTESDRFSIFSDKSILFDVNQSVQIDKNILWNVEPSISFSLPSSVSKEDFIKVNVDYMVIGTTRIYWELSKHFLDPYPYSFQVQVSQNCSNNSDDWIDVGTPVVNGFMAEDNVTRWFGKTRSIFYRVILTTPSGVYVSQPAHTFGYLEWRDWYIAQEIIRKEKLRAKFLTSVNGFLLKQRRYGVKCNRCVDKYTDEATDSKCPVCYGTRWVGGYFPPIPITFVDLSTEENKEFRSLQEGIGMKKIVNIKGRLIACPYVYAQDIWVAEGSDIRYIISSIKVEAQIRGVPLVSTVELKPLPPDDIAYSINIS